MSRLPLRVVKVGGSLLAWPGLRNALNDWLTRQSPAHDVFIAGGGALVRELPSLQAAQNLDDETTHWLAVDALGVTAKLLHALLPSQTEHANLWSAFLARIARVESPHTFTLDVNDFLHHADALSTAPLPQNWSVTSDSIAARVAANLAAPELVLLKSTFPPSFSTLRDLSGSEYVDAYFSVAAAELTRIRFVNLRVAGMPECEWNASE